MARYTFFSFSYVDVSNFRVNVVRNSWRYHNDNASFYDASIWEEGYTKNSAKLKRMIDDALFGTSVTAVLIGSDTAERRWVRYEIVKSFEQGKGIVGVHINRIMCKKRTICKKGVNPLDKLGIQVSADGAYITFYEVINGKWQVYNDLGSIPNRMSNSIFFEQNRKHKDFGKFYRFSELFNTHCWKNDDGHWNYPTWVENAAIEVGR
ncbi:TIR domain-containing protein [Mucilaginibacter sp. X4EP1]|uniref:TIR domain-containing protein n=1 Tax=Mucilaginibacter sp. X4EP1 TaxID=2723092 RepID=UPI0021683FE0|nr:TIR domain-containing protein [Mucilaginibacter sp. X4EP1]MCS3815113.1 hypothetical protein [Mucilaginibacter sp. X4EP1]